MEKLTTDTKKILGTGTTFTFNDETLTLEINPKVIIKFHFVYDSTEERKIEATPETDGSLLNVSIFNAKGIGGTSEALTIGKNETNGKDIYLSLSFQKINKSLLFNFTVFEDK